ncbi:hypothetical protein CEXT_745001 [Caerostris extrusa]|uniref:Uncharacterized protein n=1 Tax=Caerostris extrusa TaxID=172846 RepID=A0AAV4NQV2_CAEEX|nr:hypothetical protein CEXT_745001 [Caerostris extrusa]
MEICRDGFRRLRHFLCDGQHENRESEQHSHPGGRFSLQSRVGGRTLTGVSTDIIMQGITTLYAYVVQGLPSYHQGDGHVGKGSVQQGSTPRCARFWSVSSSHSPFGT